MSLILLLNNCLLVGFRLYEQSYQEGRLVGLKKRFMKGRDTLHHKINHANLMHEYMYNTMIETTFE